MVDPPSGVTDGIGDRDTGARTVRDDHEAVQPEQVSAAVRLGIEERTELACRWSTSRSRRKQPEVVAMEARTSV